MIIKQREQRLFIPMQIYHKLLSPIAKTSIKSHEDTEKDTGLLYIEIQTGGTYPLNSEEIIALGLTRLVSFH